MAKKTVVKSISGKIENAQYPYDLVILPSDCQAGTKKDHGTCVAAQAMMRKFPTCDITVSRTKAYVQFYSGRPKIRFSHNMRAEIIAFDKGGEFTPGTYHLTVPTELDNRIAPSGKDNASSTKPRRKYHYLIGVRTIVRAKAS